MRIGELVNIYATRADLPAWYRKLDSAWVWLAAIPGEWVHVVGLQRALGETLQRVFHKVTREKRVHETLVYDVGAGHFTTVKSFVVGFALDYQAEVDVLGTQRIEHCSALYIA